MNQVRRARVVLGILIAYYAAAIVLVALLVVRGTTLTVVSEGFWSILIVWIFPLLCYLVEWSTRYSRGLIRFVLSPVGYGLRHYVPPEQEYRSLQRDYAAFANPSSLHPYTSDWLAFWLRTFMGRDGTFVSSSLDRLTRNDSHTLASTDGRTIQIVGVESYINQRINVRYVPELSPTASVRVGPFARHLTITGVRGVAVFNGLITYQAATPGPLHYCTNSCLDYSTQLLAEAVDFRVYGMVRVLIRPGKSQFAWAGQTDHEKIETIVLLNAIGRYLSGGKISATHVLSSAINNPRLYPMVIHAVSHGLTLENIRVVVKEECVISITTADNDHGQEHPLGLQLVHNPILANSMVNIMSGPVTMRDCVEARMSQVASSYVVTDDMRDSIVMYAAYVAAGARIMPLEFTDLEPHLNPKQRAEYMSLYHATDVDQPRYSLFQKAEPIKSNGSARCIIAVKGIHNYKLGLYTRALVQHMKRHAWWGPGRECSYIEQSVHRVHAIALAENAEMHDTDFSSYDGTTGSLGIMVERLVMKALFSDDDYAAVSDLLDASINPKVRADYGQDDDGRDIRAIRYGIGTKSGEANTTSRNGVLAGFCKFHSARCAGLTPADAWKYLCERTILSGDDGNAVALPITAYAWMEEVGLKVKLRAYKSGHTHFLGRLYISPFFSVINVACAARVLRKLHLVRVPPGGSAHLAMAQRAAGYLITDPQTPLLSSYWLSVLRSHPVSALDPYYHDSYTYERLVSGNTYTSVGADANVIMELYAKLLGVPSEDLVTLENSFRSKSAIPGTHYFQLADLVIDERPGLVFDGVLIGKPLDSIRAERDKDVIEMENENAIATVIAADSVLFTPGEPKPDFPSLEDLQDVIPSPITTQIVPLELRRPQPSTLVEVAKRKVDVEMSSSDDEAKPTARLISPRAGYKSPTNDFAAALAAYGHTPKAVAAEKQHTVLSHLNALVATHPELSDTVAVMLAPAVPVASPTPSHKTTHRGKRGKRK